MSIAHAQQLHKVCTWSLKDLGEQLQPSLRTQGQKIEAFVWSLDFPGGLQKEESNRKKKKKDPPWDMLEISLDEDCERKQERKKRTTQWNYTGKHTEKEGSGKYQKNLGRKKIKIKEEKPTSYRVPMVLNNHRWTHLLRTLHDSS